jgi:heme exporter protein C
MIKGLWWKALGALIYLYVIIGGMTTPLKPGVLSVNPSKANTSQNVQLTVTTYNTHNAETKNLKAYLKLDSTHYIAATQVKAEGETSIKADFTLPSDLPGSEAIAPMTLIVDSDVDGAYLMPNAVFVNRSNDSIVTPTAAWMVPSNFTAESGVKFPFRGILYESIRNTFFHVALWMAMFVLLMVGLFYAVKYLIYRRIDDDILSASYNKIAILYGVLGIITGSIWAKFTWGTYWTADVKLNMTAIAMLIYLAYLVLRNNGMDVDARARLSASYSIFAFLSLIPLLFVIPRMADSLHPGNGGNPALGGEDLDNTLRLFFYPAIIGLILLGLWMGSLLVRYTRLKDIILSR